MNYGELVSSAFRITWENRYLWFFGFFVGSGFSFPSGNFNYGGDFGDKQASAADFGSVASLGGIEIALIAVVTVLIIAFILLSFLSEGGLTDSVAAISRGERRSFAPTWRAGRANMWRVFKVVVLAFLITIAGLLLIGGPLAGITIAIFNGTEDLVARIITGITVGLIALVALIVLGSALSIVVQLGLRHVVLEQSGAREAIRSGYRLFRARLGPAVLVFLLAIALAIGVVIALILALLLVGLVLAIPAIALFAGGGETAGFIAAGVAALILIPLFVTAAGAIGAFQHAYWTLAYLRLTATAPAPPSVPAVA